MNFLLLAQIRPTDTWDLGDALGAAVLVVLIVGAIAIGRVRRRR